MVVFICFTFCGGMPMLMPITFLALITRYWYFKHSFIRFCRVPKTYDDSIHKKILSIIPLALFFHILFTLWMFGVRDMFKS